MKKCIVYNGKDGMSSVIEIHSVIVHRFKVETGGQGGSYQSFHEWQDSKMTEDKYLVQPFHEWQYSEMGKWIIEKSVEPLIFHRQILDWGYKYAIEAWLKGADYTFWILKWNDQVNTK